MRAENLTANYHTISSYEKMYSGYYEAACIHCGRIIARSSDCLTGEEGWSEALARAVEVAHSCPQKPPLVER